MALVFLPQKPIYNSDKGVVEFVGRDGASSCLRR